MTTNSPSPSPSPSPKSNNSQQRLLAVAGVIVVALLVLLTVLLVNYNKRGNVIDQLTAQYDESEQLKAELEKQYYEALSELEEMRGSNEELNTLIEQQKEELKAQKDKIDGLLTDRRNLDKARKELANLRSQVDQYLAEINQLREQNAELSSQNSMLTEEKQMLSQDLESQRMANSELTSERALLVSEKENLEQDRARLSRKVNIASVIKVQNLEITPMRTKKSGKSVKRNNADNVDQLQICFNTTSNAVAENGTEIYLVRIINPLGETMAVEDLGSGVFTNNANGEQILYTQAKEFDYSGDPANLCVTWSPGQPFQQGNYEVEVYNKGYLAGSGSFRLK